MTSRGLFSGLLVIGLFQPASGPGAPTLARSAGPAKAAGVGEALAGGTSLRDLRGNRRPLRDFKGYSAIVLAFLGTDCPISNLYLSGLIELEKKYRSRQVLVLGVYPNDDEDLDRVAGHASDHDVPFLVLKDFGQKQADALGVTRVPAVTVLDKDFVLRYRGRIDDRYGVASRRPKATRDDLTE